MTYLHRWSANTYFKRLHIFQFAYEGSGFCGEEGLRIDVSYTTPSPREHDYGRNMQPQFYFSQQTEWNRPRFSCRAPDVFFSECNHIWSFPIGLRKNRLCQFSRKSVQWERRWYLWTDWQTDVTKVTGAFRYSYERSWERIKLNLDFAFWRHEW